MPSRAAQSPEAFPHVEAYLAVADDIGTAPTDILFVDDNAENVAGGQAAGLDARLVRTPGETLAILRGLTRRQRLLGE